jgi:L-alanine-DL-glutamate epimerase-like enolase superfamily enzyme
MSRSDVLPGGITGARKTAIVCEAYGLRCEIHMAGFGNLQVLGATAEDTSEYDEIPMGRTGQPDEVAVRAAGPPAEVSICGRRITPGRRTHTAVRAACPNTWSST